MATDSAGCFVQLVDNLYGHIAPCAPFVFDPEANGGLGALVWDEYVQGYGTAVDYTCTLPDLVGIGSFAWCQIVHAAAGDYYSIIAMDCSPPPIQDI